MDQSRVERILEAITVRDFSALEQALDAETRMRALLPGGVVEETSSADIASAFRRWFGECESFEVLEAQLEIIGDRPTLRYRFRVRRPGQDETVISQQVVLFGANGTIEDLHLVCTGFRPAHAVSAADPHEFDAGSLGCADGLTEAFKRQIKEISVGDLLRVHTVDPSAKEDLPSLARLMGHKVHSVEAHADGGLTITMERGR